MIRSLDPSRSVGVSTEFPGNVEMLFELKPESKARAFDCLHKGPRYEFPGSVFYFPLPHLNIALNIARGNILHVGTNYKGILLDRIRS